MYVCSDVNDLALGQYNVPSDSDPTKSYGVFYDGGAPECRYTNRLNAASAASSLGGCMAFVMARNRARKQGGVAKCKHTTTALANACAWTEADEPIRAAGQCPRCGRPIVVLNSITTPQRRQVAPRTAPISTANLNSTLNGSMPSLRPMLATEYPNSKLMEAVKSPLWVVEQKLDGHRVLLEVTNGRATAIGRNGQSSQHNALFMQRAFAHDLRQLPVDCILDGELVDNVFWVFDLPYFAAKHDGVGPHDRLSARRVALETLFGWWTPDATTFRLLPQATEEIAKSKLALTVLQGGGEGVMLKDTTSTYRSGVRAKDICKVKFVKTVDCIVTAVGVQGKDNYELSLYNDAGGLERVGRCSAIGKAKVAVGAVVEIKYLYVGADDRLYQPRMMRVRTDKDAAECDIHQLDHAKVNKTVFA